MIRSFKIGSLLVGEASFNKSWNKKSKKHLVCCSFFGCLDFFLWGHSMPPILLGIKFLDANVVVILKREFIAFLNNVHFVWVGNTVDGEIQRENRLTYSGNLVNNGRNFHING